MSNLYKRLYLMKLTDIYKLELDKFMFAFHNNRLPKIFYDWLIKLKSVHDHNTRQLTNDVYSKPSANKNIGKGTMLYRGRSLWGEIDMNNKTLIGHPSKCNTKKF